MARSLSDDPQKLRSELLGVSRRAHAIEKKLVDIERKDEGEPVATGDELHRLVEEAKSKVVHRRAGERVVSAAVEDVEASEWGEF